MSIRVTVAAPFKQRGRDTMGESEFVVALSLDRDWFSPDQAKRLIDVASSQGLVSREDGTLTVQFEPDDVEIPEEFVPDEAMLQEQSTFEQLLDLVVAAGTEKRTAVAEINELQRGVGVTVEAAAVLYARRKGVDVAPVAEEAIQGLKAES